MFPKRVNETAVLLTRFVDKLILKENMHMFYNL